MAVLKAIRAYWGRAYAAFKREFFRDPDVVLFSKGPDEIERVRDEKLGLG